MVPDSQQRDGYFDRLQHPESREGSLTWYHVSSLVFLRVCLMIANVVLISGSGSPCSSTSLSQSLSPSPQTSHKLLGHTVLMDTACISLTSGYSLISSSLQQSMSRYLICMISVNCHPHNIRHHRLPPPPPILPAPPPLPHSPRRHTQTPRHQRHRFTQHATRSHL